MRRYELSDREWALVTPHLPPPALTGRPRRSPRAIWNAILWVLRSGSPWRDLPERFGPWQTVFHRFNAWRRTGIFERVLQALQIRLDAEGHIDWDLFCVDGSNVRASRAAAGAGKKGDPRSPRTTHWVARAVDSGASSMWSLKVTEFPSRSTSLQAKRTSREPSKRSSTA